MQRNLRDSLILSNRRIWSMVCHGSVKIKRNVLNINLIMNSMKILNPDVEVEEELTNMNEDQLRRALERKILADHVFCGVLAGMVLGGLLVSLIWIASWPVQSNTGECTKTSSGLCWAVGK
jgi:hypothetical protein